MRKTFLCLVLFPAFVFANKDTLPDFSVSDKGGNRVVVSWYNKFAVTKQISVQRSTDSLTNFRTILTVPDPMNRQNGFLDAKAPDGPVFYRLYVHVDGANFFVTTPKRALPESSPVISNVPAITLSPVFDSSYLEVLDKITHEDIAISDLSDEEVRKLRELKNSRMALLPDSLSRKIDAYIKVRNKPELSVPQYRVTSIRDGLVKVVLNDFDKKNYSIRFLEEDQSLIFEIPEIKSATFLLDKSNFHHSGWYISELYDNGKLVEKNRFFIPKDF